MNSLTLKDNGFTDFVSLNTLAFYSLPYNKGSVLVLADSTLTGKPASDILYIGRTKKPTKRILGGYIAGYGGKTTRKINSKLIDDGFIEKVSIGWMLNDNPKAAQKKLLESFKKDHGEYPAWNVFNKTSQKSRPKPKLAKPRIAHKPAKSAT
jgi:hypothetical protein